MFHVPFKMYLLPCVHVTHVFAQACHGTHLKVRGQPVIHRTPGSMEKPLYPPMASHSEHLKRPKGAEGMFNNSNCWLLFQRTGVWFRAPTSITKLPVNSSSRGSNALFLPKEHPQIYTCQHVQTINTSLRNSAH